jgi:D-alanyl-D-alanine carboxypeptidase
MSRRYGYTPRRNGARTRRVTRRGSVVPLLVPPLIIATVIGAVFWLSDGGRETASCTGSYCEAAALALGASSTPTPTPEPVLAQPTATPEPLPPPEITGSAAYVREETCGAELYALNEDTPLPPASLTKMMTAIVAAENAGMDEMITSPVDGGALSLATDATVMGLAEGQQLPLRDMLYGLLLVSANDAALAIAQHVGETQQGFLDLMNEKAEELGLEDTHFANPHGLDDPRNYSSAHDIAVIGAELLQDPDLAEIVGSHSYQPAWDGGPLENKNYLLNEIPGAIGIKTGYTDVAGQTIVGAAERDGRRIVVSVLHSGDLFVDAASLLEWAFTNTQPACGAEQARSAGSARS